jgi:hypothetical protein
MGDVGGDVEGDVVLHGVRDSDMAARIRAHPDDAFDLVPGPNCGLEWRVRPDTSFGAFKALAAPQVGLPPERQRWWRFILRLNGTLRPSVLVDEDLTVGELRVSAPRHQGARGVTLFLETPPAAPAPFAPPPPLPPLPHRVLLLFFKAWHSLTCRRRLPPSPDARRPAPA